MKKVIRCMTALCMAALLVISASAATFSDTSGHWAESTIDAYSSFDVVNGYPDGTFRPDATMTRAEFASICISYSAYFQGTTGALDYTNAYDVWGGFQDVPSSAWYADAVQYTNFLFDWDNVKVWTGDYWQEATSFNFRPNEPITRGEAAQAVARMMECIQLYNNNTKFNYSEMTSNLSDVTDGSYAAMLDHFGVMSGYPDGTFKAGNQLTRAECVTVLSRMDSTMQNMD